MTSQDHPILTNIVLSALKHSHNIWSQPLKEQIYWNDCEFTETLIVTYSIQYRYSVLLHLLVTAYLSLIHVQRDQGPLCGH